MFKPVTPKVDFVEVEKKILECWGKSGILKKYLQKNNNSKIKFSFLDGPITANNPMGVHHAWGRTYKDLWQRFFNMKGCRQRFQNGFDNQGLWVEVEVEKDLGFKDKKDIEKYGIEKFVNKCKERTLKFAKVQTEQSKRLGYFMDWENSYYTMSDENNYMIWSFLKKCHQQGWLYKGKDSVPWCPRCGTAISQHEILTEEYQELTHDSVYLKLPVRDKKNTFFLVWTTTPWTIPANVALAINPDFKYGLYQKGKETLILLKDLKEKILGQDWQEIKTFKGQELKDWQYQGPFDDLPRLKGVVHKVVLDKDLVTAEEGTGIVHIAPGAGQEDFRLAKKENLDLVEAIDEEANYLDGFGQFSGQNAKNHPEIIINYLKEKSNGFFLFKIEKYKHRYPVCWRCKTELVWRLVEEWYIAMDELRPKMMAVTKKINWLPSWGKERELDWLKNMEDWLISKKRYWGLALPIWECACGHFEVIGSDEELKEKAVEGWDKFAGHSPHRPWIDEIKIKCPKCGKIASRIKDVGNPWLDAGIIPFSTLKYQTDKKFWLEWFPADFITESLAGQFKNWFYSLIAMSTVLENTNSFKTVLGHGTVLGEDGQAMHKSMGNAIDFNEGAEKMGVDVMRWLFISHNPAENLLFGYKTADEVRRRFHLLLWNIYNFFISNALISQWQPKESKKTSQNILDRWLFSRLHNLIKQTTTSLENFDAFSATIKIEKFVNDFSTWYVRRSRDRKEDCYATFYHVLVTLAKLLAPFTPFLAEEIFKNLTDRESVHLEEWPEFETKLIDENLEKQMEEVRKICELAHAVRKETKIKVRQPLSELTITNGGIKISEDLKQLIKDELNVKKTVVKEGKGELKVSLDTQITPELKAEGEARELVRQIQDLRKKAGCRLDEKIKVAGPNWPKDKNLQNYIKKETLATELLSGHELKISK
ncbi:isoleucine--tRNA ligase [Candidatus Woesebacteria bacterium CG_4_10_14_0_2_um_filter_39_14]|uniref:Isoleucine--tRNA ligase n=4 Tax=Microgenomates group TaxID=1794810 RepID=A0A2M7TK80_9BACT|nr:MAG: isoleucine--tRNA ligase [Candidatus Woesebacteria bacterium CG_4_10_14_0_2_um_filter_39_14]